MKKKIALLGMLGLCMALTACGDKKEKETTTATTEAVSEATEATTEAVMTGGKEIAGSFIHASYSDDWDFSAADDLSTGDSYEYCSLRIPDPDASWGKLRMKISVSMNAAADFTEDMHDCGMDAKKAVTENGYPTRTIGGIDCWKYDGGSKIIYFGYDAANNAFIQAEINDIEDDKKDLVASAEGVLDTVTFDFSSYEGGDVTPWYWEGTPYTATGNTLEVGSYSVTSKLIPITPSEPTFVTFDAQLGMVGDDCYIYDGEVVKKYTRSGDGYALDGEVSLPVSDFKQLDVDADGNLYVAGTFCGLVKITDGEATTLIDDVDAVALAPNRDWGVSYFSGTPKVSKLDVASGTVGEEITISGIAYVSHLFVTSDNIIMSVVDDESSDAYLLITDKDFNEVARLTSDDTTTGYFGSVSAVCETANGYVVVDGNMRDIYFLDKSFGFVGTLDMNELMGTNYPWPCSAITAEDGAVKILCTDNRVDGSCDEIVLFELSGF